MKLMVWFGLAVSFFYVTACSVSSGGNISEQKPNASKAPVAAYDKDYAEMLSGSCVTCHGPKDRDGIPSIDGKDKELLFIILKAFKDSKDESGTMGRIAKTLTYKELEILSHHFADKK